jgi:hypothetical protein
MTRHTGADPPEARSPGVAARDGYGREVSPFRPAARRPVLHRLVPVSERLGGQRAASLAAPLGLRWRFRKVPGPLVVVVAAIVASAALDLAAGISQGFPIGGSGSRTAVNDQMGARTQLSGLLAAVAIALVLLFLTAPMRYLPKATLGAVIVADGIVFVFARVKTPMRHRLEDAGVVELVGPDHLYPTVRAAVQAAANDREEPQ